MNPDTGRLMHEEDAVELRRFFGGKTREVFPKHWPTFRVGTVLILAGVDCKITDIDGRQITVYPVADVWPRVSRFETVLVATAELKVWKVTPKGIVLRHPKQCSESGSNNFSD